MKKSKKLPEQMRLYFSSAVLCIIAIASPVWSQSVSPDLPEADRGSVGGQMSSAFSPSALSRGVFRLPSPFTVPTEEGEPLWNLFPTYSPEFGLSEWGMGWQSSYRITRWRPAGTIDYSSGDRLVGPWGPMSKGDGNYWYPDGLASHVRVEDADTSVGGKGTILVAYLPDGRVATFAAAEQLPECFSSRVPIHPKPSCTYSWVVIRVVDALGRKTQIAYDQNHLPTSVSYGTDKTATPPDVISIAYEPNDPVSGRYVEKYDGPVAKPNAWRVKSVTLNVRGHARWSYALDYVNNDIASAVFYLHSVTKTFASGASVPSVTYDYNFNGSDIHTAQSFASPSAEMLMSDFQLTPEQLVGPKSFEDPGSVYFRQSNGLTSLLSNLPPGPTDWKAFKRNLPNDPANGHPFQLMTDLGAIQPLKYSQDTFNADVISVDAVAHFVGGPTDLQAAVQDNQFGPQVRFFDIFSGAKVGAATLPPEAWPTWYFSSATPLMVGPFFVDFNNDGLTDITYFENYKIDPPVQTDNGVEYPSTNIQQLFLMTNNGDGTFSSPVSLLSTSRLGRVVQELHFADLNGDGNVDVITRAPGETLLDVYYGSGAGGFAANATIGLDAPIDATESLAFVDLTGDGLADLVIVPPPEFYLAGISSPQQPPRIFINADGGKNFTEIVEQSPWPNLNPSYVLVEDLKGDGNVHVITAGSVQTTGKFGQPETSYLAFDRQFGGPGGGLMKTVDDGQGNVYSFTYKRADVAPLLQSRPSVLDRVQISSTGEVDRKFDYTFATPVMHTQGRYLVGFNDVIRTSSNGFETEESHFINDDFTSALPTSIERHGSDNAISYYESFSYVPTQVFNLPYAYNAPSSHGRGYTSRGGATPYSFAVDTVVQTQDVFCPKEITHTASDGTQLTSTFEYDDSPLPAPYAKSLVCLTTKKTVSGSIDAPEVIKYTRDSLGRVTVVTQDPDGPAPLVASSTFYNTNGTIAAVSVAGKGATNFIYFPDRPLLLKMATLPDQRVLDVSDIDPLTDAPLSVTLNGYTEFVRYDGEERVSALWDNVADGSSYSPLVSWSYQRSTANLLNVVTEERKVSAAPFASIASAQLTSASGAPLAKASLVASGWLIERVTQSDPTTGTVTQYIPSTQILADPKIATIQSLVTGAVVASSSTSSALGFPLSLSQLVQGDGGAIRHAVSSLPSASSNGIVVSSVENGDQQLKTVVSQMSGHTTGYTDPGGRSAAYQYDGLGRLTRLALADGGTATVSYDQFGRTSVVTRTLGGHTQNVTYMYDATVGRLQKKVFSADGQVTRQEAFDYDGLGRLVADVLADGSASQFQSFLYFYDGASLGAAAPPAPNAQLGLLTGVAGNGFEKRFVYNLDGTINAFALNVLGERSVVSNFTYFDDGSLKTESLQIVSPQDTTNSCLDEGITKEVIVDALGRQIQLSTNGSPTAYLYYDEKSRLSSSLTNDGGELDLTYDSVTGAAKAFTRIDASGHRFGSAWQLDSRGFIASETRDTPTSSRTRQYTYSNEGYLATSNDAVDSYTYAFAGQAGLPSSMTHGNVTTAITPAANSLNQVDSAGHGSSASWSFDSSGRVSTASGSGSSTRTFAYGPNGQVSQAVIGTHTIAYTYDESGNRIAKTSDGKFIEAQTPWGRLDDTSLTSPLQIGGVLMGTISKGFFQPLPTDVRGTLLNATVSISGVTTSGSEASPFGVRASHLAAASTTDFTGQPYDTDTGIVRMGVRDYDPASNRFLQPDPLYLENPALCIGDNVGCNLYSYASNNPVNFTDPTGTDDSNFGPDAAYIGQPPDPGVAVPAFTPSVEEMTFLADDDVAQLGAGVEYVSTAAGDLTTFWDAAGMSAGDLGAIGALAGPTFEDTAPPPATLFATPSSMVDSVPIASGIYQSSAQGISDVRVGDYAGASHAFIDAGMGILNLWGAAGAFKAAGTAVLVTGGKLAIAEGATASIPKVGNAKLGNLVRDLFKGARTPNPIGTGSTADAIRHELSTGTAVGGKFHTQKGVEYSKALQNWLAKNPGASHYDQMVAKSVLDDLLRALGGQ